MIRVITDHPVALTSNDHLHPRGTAADNSVNPRFCTIVQELFGPKASVLDLGCSGGGMVNSFLRRGHVAVGIEGSDYSQKHKRAEWKHLDGTHLFTADITKPFKVMECLSAHSEWVYEQLRFDVITMWEVIEHIAEDDLPQLFENIRTHLAKTGIVVMSVSPNEDRLGDVSWHQCIHDLPWWETKLASLRWFNNQGLVNRFKGSMVRGDPQWSGTDNAPGSFHMVLERG